VQSFSTNLKMNPPLRSIEHRQALIAGIADGTIDAIATDHAPHTPEAKERPFEEAPPGMLGLETALAVTITELVGPGILELEDALALLSWRPAAIAGLAGQGRPVEPGNPANLVVFDPAHEWEVRADRLASRARNTPFAGRTLRGRVKHTLFAGNPVVIDGEATR
jgi:dihydroorotase